MWGQEQLAASKPTIFDEAFPFLGLRQIQASQLRADARRVPVPKETQDPTYTERSSSPTPATYGPSLDVVGQQDEGKEPEKSEGSRKRRKTGALLRLDESVVVRKARGAFVSSRMCSSVAGSRYVALFNILRLACQIHKSFETFDNSRYR